MSVRAPLGAPMTPMERVLRALRGRRLVIGLLAAVALLAVAATLVPQGAAESPRVAAWAAAHPAAETVARVLGLHGAFSSPVFLALVLLLAASTAVCAAERTGRARRSVGRSSRLPDGDVMRLRNAPDVERLVPPGRDAWSALESVGTVLSARSMRVRLGRAVLEADSHTWGAWGSPVFHWAMVALMAVIVAGAATRSEGMIDLVIDEPVREAPDAYAHLDSGVLFGNRHTGYTLVADDLAESFVWRGVDRGPAPRITVLRGETILARQRVFPNNSLHAGVLTVHVESPVPVVAMSVEASNGVLMDRMVLPLEYSTAASGTTEPAELTFRSQSGEPLADIRVWVPLSSVGRPATQAPDLVPAMVQTSTVGSGEWGAPVTLALGKAAAISRDSGVWVRYVRLDDAVRVRVVNDWSLPAIYALFALIVAGLAVAMLVVPRRAVAILDEADGVTTLRFRVDARREPGFRRELADAVRAALDGPSDAEAADE